MFKKKKKKTVSANLKLTSFRGDIIELFLRKTGCQCAYSVAKLCLTLRPRRLKPARLLCPWDFLGKNTGVGCHFLLHGIFLTQGSNPCVASPALAGRFFTTEPPRKTGTDTQIEMQNAVRHKSMKA